MQIPNATANSPGNNNTPVFICSAFTAHPQLENYGFLKSEECEIDENKYPIMLEFSRVWF